MHNEIIEKCTTNDNRSLSPYKVRRYFLSVYILTTEEIFTCLRAHANRKRGTG